MSLRHATDDEADEHSDLTDDDGVDLLVAEVRNTSRDTIRAVNVAIPDHLPVHAAVLEAPNRDASLPLTGLLWPADQVATSNRGWNTGRLDPGQHATIYLATDPPAHHITIRATATGITPITINLHGPTLPTTQPSPESRSSPDSVPVVDALDWQRVEHDETVFGGDGDQWMSSVTAGGPGLVAVGRDRDQEGEKSAAVWTSTDGVDWQRVEHDETVFGGDGDQWMTSVTAGGPRLVAVGTDVGRAAAAVWTSTNGLDWERIEHDETVFGGDGMTSVTAGGPGLVAVGIDFGRAAAAVWTSTDGLDWERIEHNEAVFGGDGGQWMWSVTAGGPGLVAVGRDRDRDQEGEGSAAVWTSTDGVDWQRVEHDDAVFGGDGDQFMWSVTAGGPGLVAVGRDRDQVGEGSAAVWTSTDGVDWQRVEHDETVFGGDGDQWMTSVTAGGPGLVAVGIDFGRAAAAVWTSTNGLDWQRVEHDEAVFAGDRLQEMLAVTTGGPGLVAVGVDNDQQGERLAMVWTSP